MLKSICGVGVFRCLPLLAAVWIGLAGLVSAGVTVDELRCEYAVNPVGIDTLQPRLSWTLRATERAQRQSAYQLRVAASPQAASSARTSIGPISRPRMF